MPKHKIEEKYQIVIAGILDVESGVVEVDGVAKNIMQLLSKLDGEEVRIVVSKDTDLS